MNIGSDYFCRYSILILSTNFTIVNELKEMFIKISKSIIFLLDSFPFILYFYILIIYCISKSVLYIYIYFCNYKLIFIKNI